MFTNQLSSTTGDPVEEEVDEQQQLAENDPLASVLQVNLGELDFSILPSEYEVESGSFATVMTSAATGETGTTSGRENDRYDLADSWHQESRVKSQCRDYAVVGRKSCSVEGHMWERCSAVMGGAGTMRSHGAVYMSRKKQESRVRNTTQTINPLVIHGTRRICREEQYLMPTPL